LRLSPWIFPWRDGRRVGGSPPETGAGLRGAGFLWIEVALLDGEFLRRAENVLVFGSPGSREDAFVGRAWP